MSPMNIGVKMRCHFFEEHDYWYECSFMDFRLEVVM